MLGFSALCTHAIATSPPQQVSEVATSHVGARIVGGQFSRGQWRTLLEAKYEEAERKRRKREQEEADERRRQESAALARQAAINEQALQRMAKGPAIHDPDKLEAVMQRAMAERKRITERHAIERQAALLEDEEDEEALALLLELGE